MVSRLFSRWRYLLSFWVALLVTASAGGVVLQLLGPPDHVGPGSATGVAPRRARPASLGSLARTPPVRWPTEPAPLDVVIAVDAPWPAFPEADRHPAHLPPPTLARKPPTLWLTQPADVAVAASSPFPDWPIEHPARLLPRVRAAGVTESEGAPRRNQILITLHPAGSEDTRELAQHLAAGLGLAPDQIGTGVAGGFRPGVVIRFYSAGDHMMARRIGNELTGMGYSWRIENLSSRPPVIPHQGLDVWLTGR